MSHSVLAQIAHDAARYGFFKSVETDNGRRKVAWVIKCSKCPRQFSAYWVANTSAELMAKNMKIRHWDVGRGERPLCPECAHPRADKSPVVAKASLPDGERYIPPKTAIVAALEKAVEAAGLPKLPQHVKDNADIAFLHVKERDGDMTNKAQLLNGTIGSTARIEADATPKFRTDMIPAITQEPNFALTLDIAKPPRLKLDGTPWGVRGPDKKPRKTPQRKSLRDFVGPRKKKVEIDYQHEFDDRKFKPYPETPKPTAIVKEADDMNATSPTPKPKIAHAVFQHLDSVFDPETRLYKNGYTDARVAQDCGTSEDVVAYLRKETFGDLAEDPRITGLREDLELVRMEMTDILKKLNGTFDSLSSRLEQIAVNTKSR